MRCTVLVRGVAEGYPEWAHTVGLQVVLKKAHNYAEINDAVHHKITEFAGRGFRALGVAITPDDGTPSARPLAVLACSGPHAQGSSIQGI